MPFLVLNRPRCTRRLDEIEDGSAIQDYLQEKTGQRTVPNIFISEYSARIAMHMRLTIPHRQQARWRM